MRGWFLRACQFGLISSGRRCPTVPASTPRRRSPGHERGRRRALDNRKLRTYTARVKPNPPYMATIVIAILLMVIGLSLEGSLFSIAPLNQVLGDVLAVIGIKASQELARILIIASPTLLIIGSLVKGI
jgi:hypothetical protein